MYLFASEYKYGVDTELLSYRNVNFAPSPVYVLGFVAILAYAF
jgi:hypothetical protein